jgi:hypothetical protein
MKKTSHPEIKAGIWLDREKAFVIRIIGEHEPVIEKIKPSRVSKTRSGRQVKAIARPGHPIPAAPENIQKSQRLQRRHYFNAIIDLIRDADFISIFGPGKARLELYNAIDQVQLLKKKVVAVEAANKITKSQMMALVNKYFNSDSFMAKRET